MKTEASIQNGDEVLDGGRFIEPEIIGIIKKRSGICKRENRVAYEKVWEDEKEVRIKLMTASVDGSKSDIVNIGLHFILKNVRPYAASCSEA